MLTKTLHFEDDVLDVLRAMDWRADGTQAVITGGQLERKLYERVNKALEGMGGKWNRAAKAHVFPADPRPQVEGLLESGALTVARDGFFETPPAVVQRMLALLPLPSSEGAAHILEPEAGTGAIVRELIRAGAFEEEFVLVEQNPKRCELLRDAFPAALVNEANFLELIALHRFDRIYMNPPFEEGQDMQHVERAYQMLRPGGALVSVMGEHAFFAGDRRAVAFRAWMDSLDAYTEKLPPASFHESGTDVATRLVRLTHPLYRH